MTTAVIVAAAGLGERLGPGLPKALRLLAGEPLLLHALRQLAAAPSVDHIVVAAPVDDVVEVRELLAGVLPERVGLDVVAGGADRQDSVRRALNVLADDVDVVLVHDAARALVPVALVEAVVAAVRAGADAVGPVLPLSDTVKRVDSGDRVIETLDRSQLRTIQTPQGFRRSVLAAAHGEARGSAPGGFTANRPPNDDTLMG